MNLHVEALGACNRLAHAGAERAAASLGELTGTEPHVGETAINLVSFGHDVPALVDNELVGVQLDFDGEFSGQLVLALERASASRLLDCLPGNGSAPAECHMEEVGNIIMGRFLDNWADYLESCIDFTPPKYIEGTGNDIMPSDRSDRDDKRVLFVFTSTLDVAAEAVELLILLLPTVEDLDAFGPDVVRHHGVTIPAAKLPALDDIAAESADKASADITTLTGIETRVQVSGLTFLPVEAITSRIEAGRYAGVVIECHGLPGGYVLVLFDEPSARTIAEELVQMPVGSNELTEIHQSAIKEVGNIVTSGFVDGWANVLQTTIDISPPRYVHADGEAILHPVVSSLEQRQEFAFVIDSTIVTTDRHVTCKLFVLPDEGDLGRALDELPIDRSEPIESGAVPMTEIGEGYEDL